MVAFDEDIVHYGDSDNKKHLFFHAAGPTDGPLLIFIHGWPAIGKTWKHSLETFASLGYRCIAPDMPGYGRSTARKVTEDYSQEAVNLGMLALLDHLGRERAVWIGHDWGCPSVWSFAEQYPERCHAAAGLAVPAFTFESVGLEGVIETVNRDIYPEDKYPDGQWSYQRFYEQNFEKSVRWNNADPRAFLRAGYARGSPAAVGKPAKTATTVADGGWGGGSEKPDPTWRQIPIEATCIDEELYEELCSAMETTGFWGANAWYMNHARNKAYFERSAKNDGYLHMPVLFIEAKYDTICDTVNSSVAERQRRYCSNLTEVSIASGHWLPVEKPAEVNAAIARWLVEKCPQQWPGPTPDQPSKAAL